MLQLAIDVRMAAAWLIACPGMAENGPACSGDAAGLWALSDAIWVYYGALLVSVASDEAHARLEEAHARLEKDGLPF